jgi:hypothetical protein
VLGDSGRVKLTLKLVLPRSLAKRLRARAIEEGKKLDHRVAEVLERAKQTDGGADSEPTY